MDFAMNELIVNSKKYLAKHISIVSTLMSD